MPTVVTAAAAVVAVEGAALVVLSVILAVHGVTGSPSSLGLAEGAAALGVLAGVVLLLLARGVRRGRRWARTPVVLCQLLALPVGIALVQASRVGYGAPLLLCAVSELVLLAQRDARATFEDGLTPR